MEEDTAAILVTEIPLVMAPFIIVYLVTTVVLDRRTRQVPAGALHKEAEVITIKATLTWIVRAIECGHFQDRRLILAIILL